VDGSGPCGIRPSAPENNWTRRSHGSLPSFSKRASAAAVLLNRNERIGPVHLVKVDVVRCVGARNEFLDLLSDCGARRRVSPHLAVSPFEADLWSR